MIEKKYLALLSGLDDFRPILVYTDHNTCSIFTKNGKQKSESQDGFFFFSNTISL